jgi:hypothetical protein
MTAGKASLRGRLGRGSEKEGTGRRGGSMGRELSGLMAAASARDERGGGSGEALPSSESASEAMGAAEPSLSELASGVSERERGLGLLAALRDGDAAGFGGAGRWSASDS